MELDEIAKKFGLTDEQLRYIGLGVVLSNKETVFRTIPKIPKEPVKIEIRKITERTERGSFNVYPQVRSKLREYYETRLGSGRNYKFIILKEIVWEDGGEQLREDTGSVMHAVIKGKLYNGTWKAKDIFLTDDGICYVRGFGSTDQVPSRHKMNLDETRIAAEKVGGEIIDVDGESSHCIRIKNADEEFIRSWLALWNEI